MKFILKDGSVISFQDRFSLVNKDVSPIKDIISRKDLSEFYYADENTISFKELIQIQVNVIDVGVMIFVFQTATFNKDSYISEVSKLKEMQINSFYDVLSKMKALYAVSEPFNPLFVIYIPNGKYQIYDDCFKTMNTNIFTLYVTEAKQEVKVEANKVAIKQMANKNENKKEGEKISFKERCSEIFGVIKKEKIHFLFSVIATLLLSVTLAIGVFDSYAGKMICIFFFICSLAGAFLNFMIYKDTYKQSGFKSLFNILTIVFSVIGIGVGLAIYMIFKSLTKDVPEVQPHVLLIIALMIILYAISMALPLLISFIKEKKK